jgi:uncharacterized protein YkwD
MRFFCLAVILCVAFAVTPTTPTKPPTPAPAAPTKPPTAPTTPPAAPAAPVAPVNGAIVAGSPTALAILANHNTLRAGKAVPALIWDAGLASDAARYALKCVFPIHDATRHTSPSNSQPTKFTTIGENMYGSMPPATNLTTVAVAACNSFAAEAGNYIAGQPTGSNCKAGTVCGHYTQMMWKATTAVGCGHQICNPPTGATLTGAWSIVICRYGPSGNFIGQVPFETTNAASEQFQNGDAAYINVKKPYSVTMFAGVFVVAALVAMIVVVARKIRQTPTVTVPEEMTEHLA